MVSCGAIRFLVLPSKMDANKKRKITFENDRDSKFVYKLKFSILKFCYQWCVACLANFCEGVTAKKIENHCNRITDIEMHLL